jgi:hypothetical protein
MGCRCNPLRLIYLGEAPDIKQKATSDRLISPCGDIESIMRAAKRIKNLVHFVLLFIYRFYLISSSILSNLHWPKIDCVCTKWACQTAATYIQGVAILMDIPMRSMFVHCQFRVLYFVST